MEKTIKCLLVLCFGFGVSCSGSQEEETQISKAENKVSEKEQVESQTFCGNLLNTEDKLMQATEVPWMYMDDSLKNLCRPLNFVLPDMPSDINTLPEFPTIEIARFQMFHDFTISARRMQELSDSLVAYSVILRLGGCKCVIVRKYQGNPEDRSFDGYVITEQIICNALDPYTSF